MRHHQAHPADDPAVATLADVVKVAAATIAILSGPVATPSERASSSGRDMTFIRHRSAISTAVPIATGPNKGSRSERSPRQAAEQPEGHGRQLVVRIGKIFHEADAGAKQRADHDARQHQHQDRIARSHGRADGVDGGNSEQATKKGKSLNGQHAEREEKCR